mmetsp:Transcript_12215/g.36423  ORF Transcript_12215/g.36423 Transcript_12215/m.36423 type:complete len:1389 (-) Transcript_12215:2224-6390(-)
MKFFEWRSGRNDDGVSPATTKSIRERMWEKSGADILATLTMDEQKILMDFARHRSTDGRSAAQFLSTPRLYLAGLDKHMRPLPGRIGDAQCSALALILAHNKVLQSFNMEGSDVTDEGIAKVAAALPLAARLSQANFAHLRLSPIGLQLLVPALVACPALEATFVDRWPVDANGEHMPWSAEGQRTWQHYALDMVSLVPPSHPLGLEIDEDDEEELAHDKAEATSENSGSGEGGDAAGEKECGLRGAHKWADLHVDTKSGDWLEETHVENLVLGLAFLQRDLKRSAAYLAESGLAVEAYGDQLCFIITALFDQDRLRALELGILLASRFAERAEEVRVFKPLDARVLLNLSIAVQLSLRAALQSIDMCSAARLMVRDDSWKFISLALEGGCDIVVATPMVQHGLTLSFGGTSFRFFYSTLVHAVPRFWRFMTLKQRVLSAVAVLLHVALHAVLEPPALWVLLFFPDLWPLLEQPPEWFCACFRHAFPSLPWVSKLGVLDMRFWVMDPWVRFSLSWCADVALAVLVVTLPVPERNGNVDAGPGFFVEQLVAALGGDSAAKANIDELVPATRVNLACVWVLASIVTEVMQLFALGFWRTPALAVGRYFRDIWNWQDVLALSFTAAGLWLYCSYVMGGDPVAQLFGHDGAQPRDLNGLGHGAAETDAFQSRASLNASEAAGALRSAALNASAAAAAALADAGSAGDGNRTAGSRLAAAVASAGETARRALRSTTHSVGTDGSPLDEGELFVDETLSAHYANVRLIQAVLGIASTVLCQRVLRITYLFSNLGPLMRMVWLMGKDVAELSLFGFCFCVSVAAGFHVMFKGAPVLHEAWGGDSNAEEECAITIVGTLDDADFGPKLLALIEIFLGGEGPAMPCLRATAQGGWAWILQLDYTVLNVVLLLNMLIAMMSKTFDVVYEARSLNFLVTRTQIIHFSRESALAPPPLNLLGLPSHALVVLWRLTRRRLRRTYLMKVRFFRSILEHKRLYLQLMEDLDDPSAPGAPEVPRTAREPSLASRVSPARRERLERSRSALSEAAATAAAAAAAATIAAAEGPDVISGGQGSAAVAGTADTPSPHVLQANGMWGADNEEATMISFDPMDKRDDGWGNGNVLAKDRRHPPPRDRRPVDLERVSPVEAAVLAQVAARAEQALAHVEEELDDVAVEERWRVNMLNRIRGWFTDLEERLDKSGVLDERKPIGDTLARVPEQDGGGWGGGPAASIARTSGRGARRSQRSSDYASVNDRRIGDLAAAQREAGAEVSARLGRIEAEILRERTGQAGADRGIDLALEVAAVREDQERLDEKLRQIAESQERMMRALEQMQSQPSAPSRGSGPFARLRALTPRGRRGRGAGGDAGSGDEADQPPRQRHQQATQQRGGGGPRIIT